MGTTRSNDSLSEAVRQLDRLRSGTSRALGERLPPDHDRLRRMVELRMRSAASGSCRRRGCASRGVSGRAARDRRLLRDPRVSGFSGCVVCG